MTTLVSPLRPDAAPDHLYTAAARAFLTAERDLLHIDPPTEQTVAWEATRPDLRAAVDAVWASAHLAADELQRRINGALHLLVTADPSMPAGHIAVLLHQIETVLTTSRDTEGDCG